MAWEALRRQKRCPGRCLCVHGSHEGPAFGVDFSYFAWCEVRIESGNTVHLTHFSLKPGNPFPFWRHGRRRASRRLLLPAATRPEGFPAASRSAPRVVRTWRASSGRTELPLQGFRSEVRKPRTNGHSGIPGESLYLPQPQPFGHRSIKSREARSGVPRSFPCTSGGDLTPTGRFSPPLSRHCAVVKSG